MFEYYVRVTGSFSACRLQLTSGTAEVYGAELAPGRLYLFGGECKAAVFTWYGCTLEISCPFQACIRIHLYHTS
jgi:hypothetical protein